ncbi:MAG: universal stress protein [Rhodocyclaceae bacterium]|nr:universal stress protein [Rhodocyclaceae bacterium]
MDTQPESQSIIAAPHPTGLKLLLPVDATERSRWGINYARRRKRSGHEDSVFLLFVSEPVTSWEVLRFRTQEEVRHFQSEHGQYLLEDAAQPLAEAGIPVHMNYREGSIVFQILDIAEQLDCDEIVLPVPRARWSSLFSTDVVREVVRLKRGIPVCTVNADGMIERSWQSR